jgi:hypothetical protein
MPSSPPYSRRLTARKNSICAKASVIMMKAMPLVRRQMAPTPKATSAPTPKAASSCSRPLSTPWCDRMPTA